MLIAWRTVEPADTMIEHGLDTNYGQRDSDPAQVTSHALLLTDLSPGTVYHYRIIGNGEALTDDLTFKTAPDPLGDVKFRFAVFADTGAGDQAQLAVASQVAASRPDLGIHVGDLAYPGGEPDDLDVKYFNVYRDLIATVPFYLAIGNKDVEFDGGKAFLEAFYLPENSTDPERYYSFEYGNAFFIALDTNQDFGPGSRQMDWLKERLADSEHRWKIVFLHHPLISSGPNVPDARSYLQPIFDEHGVDLVIQAHNHFYERTFPLEGSTKINVEEEPAYVNPLGTVYLVTGGGGGSLRPGTPNGESARFKSIHHHVVVDVDNDVLSLQAIDSTGNVIDSMTITKSTAPPEAIFHRGDADGNGTLQLTDAIRILGFLFLGTPAPECLEAADSDDNGTLQLTDAIRILNYAFSGGQAPPPPGPPPSACGPDPKGSPALGCKAYPGCAPPNG